MDNLEEWMMVNSRSERKILDSTNYHKKERSSANIKETWTVVAKCESERSQHNIQVGEAIPSKCKPLQSLLLLSLT